MTSTIDLPTQHTDEAETVTPEVELAPSDIEGAVTDFADVEEGAPGGNPLAGLP